MLKNILILCLTIIFSISISAADLYAEKEAKPSQVSVEMKSMTCEGVDTVTTDELNNFEPIQLRALSSSACQTESKYSLSRKHLSLTIAFA